MQRRYRVAHLITRLELGGAQQNTLFCTRHHDRTCFDVGLIAGRGGLLDGDAEGIADAHVELVPYLKHPVSPMHDLFALLRLRSTLREGRVDLVHTHSSKAGILGRWAARLAGVPHVVHTVHGWSFNDTQPAWLRRLYVALEKITARISDRLIVVSTKNRETGLELGIGRPEQYRVVRSGIDVSPLRRDAGDRDRVRAALGYRPEEIVVGTLSCLKPQKAPLDFVEAAARAYGEDDRLRFFIAGDGELRPAVGARIAALGLGEVVRLLGWRRDVADLLVAMDLFLLTSHFEGLPRAVLQAMAAGVPVVATAVDGTPEVVEDRVTGLLVPPARPDLAASALLELVADAGLRERCVSDARRAVSGRFEIRQMVRALDGLYLDLLERNG